jgi:hypothetical protein
MVHHKCFVRKSVSSLTTVINRARGLNKRCVITETSNFNSRTFSSIIQDGAAIVGCEKINVKTERR